MIPEWAPRWKSLLTELEVTKCDLQFFDRLVRDTNRHVSVLPLSWPPLNLMTQTGLIPVERIERAIYLIRGEKVMLDRDLAALYGVETKVLKRAVRRNIDRFPNDFMFVLNATEFRNWRSQFVISNSDRRGLRHSPMAFTEHGILMLSSVLNSKRATQVNIEIMRAFVRLRQMLASNVEYSRRLDELESKYDRQFKVVFDALRQIMTPTRAKQPRIGFRQSNEG